MKTASAAVLALVNGATELPWADCFTLTLIDGTVLRYTSLDVPVWTDGFYYAANAVRIDGLKYKCAVGLDIDEQEVDIIAGSTDLLNGIPFLQAIREMVLDGALLQRNRAFFDPDTAFPLARQTGVAYAVGSINLFAGRVADVKAVGDTSAQVNVKSGLVLLDIDFPRNLWQPSCLHTLFDSGCGLNKASYTGQGVVGAGATYNVVPFGQGGTGAAAHAVMTGTAGAAIAKVVLTSSAAVNATYLAAPTITAVDPSGAGSGAVLAPISTPHLFGGGWGLYGIAVKNGGSNYGPNTYVVITPHSGDPGAGATAQIVFAAGAQSVGSLVIDAEGENYSAAAQFVISGGGGNGAQFKPVIVNGQIVGSTAISFGSGYSSAPNVEIVDGIMTNYAQGTIEFSTGQNAGATRQIQSASNTALLLVEPLDYIPAEGDCFMIWPGCDHTTGAGGCAKYNNLPNFRGFPFVPPPETAY